MDNGAASSNLQPHTSMLPSRKGLISTNNKLFRSCNKQTSRWVNDYTTYTIICIIISNVAVLNIQVTIIKQKFMAFLSFADICMFDFLKSELSRTIVLFLFVNLRKFVLSESDGALHIYNYRLLPLFISWVSSFICANNFNTKSNYLLYLT